MDNVKIFQFKSKKKQFAFCNTKKQTFWSDLYRGDVEKANTFDQFFV